MKCSNCKFDETLGADGLCDDCREAVKRDTEGMFDGALCARCDISLDSEGYCPNEKCPFHSTYQDELTESWKPPGAAERAYIRQIERKLGDY